MIYTYTCMRQTSPAGAVDPAEQGDLRPARRARHPI